MTKLRSSDKNEGHGLASTNQILLIEHDNHESEEEYGPPDAGGSSNSEPNTFYKVESAGEQDDQNSAHDQMKKTFGSNAKEAAKNAYADG